MGLLRRWIFIAIAIIFLATIAGLFLTRGSLTRIRNEHARVNHSGQSIVDQDPVRQANSLAAQAATLEEQLYAADAQRLAEHATDLAFSQVLREDAERMQHLTGQAAVLDQRRDAATQKVKDDRAAVAQ